MSWRRLASFKDWTTRDLVVAAVLSVAVGVVFWAWGMLWTATGMDNLFPSSYALVGLWMMGGLLIPYVIRRPGAALFGELVAAFVSMALGNKWGITTMASGLVQGVGAELVFGLGMWRHFRGAEFRLRKPRVFGISLALPVWRAGSGLFFYGAAALAGLFSIVLDIFVWSYYAAYSWSAILAAAILCVASSVILGGVLSQVLGEALVKTGVLSGLEISRGKVRRV